MALVLRTAFAATGALALLAGCSSDADAPVSAENSAAATVPADNAPAVAPPAPSSSPAPSANLSAKVSTLAGAKSDLNVRMTEFGTVIDLPADALFAYDKATLSPDAEAQLRKAADLIRSRPATDEIQVIGHTDDHGGEAYNLKLSKARAQTVADWLAQQVGIRERHFTIIGKGKAEPLVPNRTVDGRDSPENRAQNRRVELILPKAE